MLRLLLPPNLPDAALRDAISLKVELDLNSPPNPAHLPGLAVLQTLCNGAAQPPPFIQVNRDQLRQLVASLAGQPVFAWLREPAKPILWIGPRLRGVSEHLAPVSSSAPRPSPPVPPPARRALPGSASYHRAASRDEPATPLLVDGSEHFLAITLPSREHTGYAAALDLVKTNGFTLEPANRKWWLRDRHKVLNFLASHRTALDTEFFAEFTPNFEKNTARFATATVSCEITAAGPDYALTLGLDAGRVPDDQLRAAVATNRGYVEDQGKIYLIPPATLEQLTRAQRIIAGGAAAPLSARRVHQIAAARVCEIDELITELAPDYQPPAAWRRRAEALKNLATLEPAPIPADFTATLRPYQHIGVAWLWHLHRNRLGGILADEMGLGKTAQAIALLAAVNAQHPTSNAQRPTTNSPLDVGRSTLDVGRSGVAHAPSLVICPASLVENWRRETARFAPHLRVFIHHGVKRLTAASEAAAHDVIITSYGTAARDREFFGDLDLACLIADEAQHVKNRRSQNARALRALRARSRFFLTGTPLENSLDDLRSLFETLLPGMVEKLPSGLKSDERAFHDERLRIQTAPYILRRTKLAVAPELPEKIEQVIYCEPGARQAALYREFQTASEDQLMQLAGAGASENAIRLATLTQLLRLRQICCDPRLVAPGASSDDSAKLDAFRELLAEAVDDGHRILVFSQFTSLLAHLREELAAQDIAHCYLDGSMSAKARQAEVDRFNQSDTVPVFLISLKAGGTGLNLTGADTVIHFDPWWNPAVEAQATDRAHRIGQTRVVTSYKLICSGTVEEKVLALQETKRALLADVFDASDAANAKLELADLQALLRA